MALAGHIGGELIEGPALNVVQGIRYPMEFDVQRRIGANFTVRATRITIVCFETGAVALRGEAAEEDARRLSRTAAIIADQLDDPLPGSLDKSRDPDATWPVLLLIPSMPYGAPLRRERLRRFDIRLWKIVTLVEKGNTGVAGAGISEAIAEVQSRRMS